MRNPEAERRRGEWEDLIARVGERILHASVARARAAPGCARIDLIRQNCRGRWSEVDLAATTVTLTPEEIAAARIHDAPQVDGRPKAALSPERIHNFLAGDE